jgi:hypothetical protein
MVNSRCCLIFLRGTKHHEGPMFIDVSKKEFEGFKAQAKASEWGWPAVLSTNEWRETWHPPGWGFTPADERRPGAPGLSYSHVSQKQRDMGHPTVHPQHLMSDK